MRRTSDVRTSANIAGGETGNRQDPSIFCAADCIFDGKRNQRYQSESPKTSLKAQSGHGPKNCRIQCAWTLEQETNTGSLYIILNTNSRKFPSGIAYFWNHLFKEHVCALRTQLKATSKAGALLSSLAP